MNIYVVTEGKTEAIVYKCWIPFVNDKLISIDHLSELSANNIYIVSAKGYPDYFNIIANAIEDVNTINAFDRLVISVDSEDLTREEKINELREFVAPKWCRVEVRIVIQHFCFETWALGNRKIVRPNTTSVRLREYCRLFNVRSNDPELLPAKSDEELNRSQFAKKYLRTALNDKFKNLTYSTGDPQALLHEKYFVQIEKRLKETQHIASFQDFLSAFV
jgi:hypothetical protein